MTTVIRRGGRFAVCAFVLLTGALLAGCTANPGGPADSASSKSSKSSTSTASPSGTVGSGNEKTKTVRPVIVVAGVDVDGKAVSASGYISGVIESGKTCVFVFTGPGSSVRVEHAGTADRLTTSCGTVTPPIAEFTKGAWQVVLQYPSSGSTLSSTPVSLEVP